MARRTTSLLLGTATPVQIQPIEAYDLLEALSQGNDHVLGNELSAWRRDKRYTLLWRWGRSRPGSSGRPLGPTAQSSARR